MDNIRIILHDDEYIGEYQILQKSQFITSMFDICDKTQILDFTICNSDFARHIFSKKMFDVYYNTLVNLSYLDTISPNDYNFYIKMFDYLCFSEGLAYINGLIKKVISEFAKYDNLQESFYQCFDNDCDMLIYFFNTVDKKYISNIQNKQNKQNKQIKTLLSKVIKSLYHDDDNIFSLRNDIDEIRFYMSDTNSFDVIQWSIPQTYQYKKLCDITEFTHDFNLLTHDFFNTDFDWSNIVISGGSIYTILTKKTMKKYSDIDIWLYGDIETQRKKLFYIINRFRTLFPTIYVGINLSVVYVFINDLQIYFNIICSAHHTKPIDIITNFDLSHAMMFYDGYDVHFTSYSLASILYGVVKLFKKIAPLRLRKLYDLGLSLLTCDDCVTSSGNYISYKYIEKHNKYYTKSTFRVFRVEELNLDIEKSAKLLEQYYPQSIHSEQYNRTILMKTNNINDMHIINNINNIDNIDTTNNDNVIQNIVSSVCYIKKFGAVISDYLTESEQLSNKNANKKKIIKYDIHNCSIQFVFTNYYAMRCKVDKLRHAYIVCTTTNASLMELITREGDLFTMHNVSIEYVINNNETRIIRIYGLNYDYKIYKLSNNKASLYYNSGYGKTYVYEHIDYTHNTIYRPIPRIHKLHNIKFVLLYGLDIIAIDKHTMHQSPNFIDELIKQNKNGIGIGKQLVCEHNYYYRCKTSFIFDDNVYKKKTFLTGYFFGDIIFEISHRGYAETLCIIDRDNVPLNKYKVFLNKFNDIRTDISAQNVNIYTYFYITKQYYQIFYNNNEPLVLSLSNTHIVVKKQIKKIEYHSREYIIILVMNDYLTDLVKQIMLKFNVEYNIGNIDEACTIGTYEIDINDIETNNINDIIPPNDDEIMNYDSDTPDTAELHNFYESDKSDETDETEISCPKIANKSVLVSTKSNTEYDENNKFDDVAINGNSDNASNISDHKMINDSANTNINKQELTTTKLKTEYVGAIVRTISDQYGYLSNAIKNGDSKCYKKTANLVLHIEQIYKTSTNKYIPVINCLKCDIIK